MSEQSERLERFMNEGERGVWRAAYGAAAHVRAMERSAAEHPPAGGYAEQGGTEMLTPIDVAIVNVTAEYAITIADAAVHRLRQWRNEEDDDAGVVIGKLPKEWDDAG